MRGQRLHSNNINILAKPKSMDFKTAALKDGEYFIFSCREKEDREEK